MFLSVKKSMSMYISQDYRLFVFEIVSRIENFGTLSCCFPLPSNDHGSGRNFVVPKYFRSHVARVYF